MGSFTAFRQLHITISPTPVPRRKTYFLGSTIMLTAAMSPLKMTTRGRQRTDSSSSPLALLSASLTWMTFRPPRCTICQGRNVSGPNPNLPFQQSRINVDQHARHTPTPHEHRVILDFNSHIDSAQCTFGSAGCSHGHTPSGCVDDDPHQTARYDACHR